MSKLLVDEISDADNTGPVTVTDGLIVTGTLTAGNQVFTGSSHSITGDYSVNMSSTDGGGVDIKKDAGEGSYPLYVTMQDLSNYTSGDAANYVQALQFYADAQNKYSSSGAELQILGEMRMEYDNTTLGFGSDQGAGKLMLRARQNSSDPTINNLKDHLVIHGFGGDVELGVGNLKVQSGKGIDFSAVTGGTGTATSNVLDDYEEGNWVPTFAGLAPTSITSAKYVKVGSLVFFSTQIVTPSTASTTYMWIGGLPFGTAADSSASMAYTTSAYFSPAMQVQTTSVYFYKASGASYTMADYSNVHLRFSGHYYTTA